MTVLYEIGQATAASPTAFTRRYVIAASALAATANRVRIRWNWYTGSYQVTDAWIGLQATSGDAYDIDPATLVRLTQGGSNTHVVDSADSYSDEVDLDVDGTRAVVISLYTGDVGQYLVGANTGLTGYYLAGNSAGTADLAGMTALNSPVFMFRALEGSTVSPFTMVRAIFDQGYDLLETILVRNVLVQLYGINLLTYITQLYGDTDQLRTQLVARYQSNPVVKTILQQLYKSASVAKARLDQGYSLNEVLTNILRQDYVLTQALMNSSLTQSYGIKNIYELANFLSQQYVIYPDSKTITDTTTLTINGK